jgi:hypothetical protein
LLISDVPVPLEQWGERLPKTARLVEGRLKDNRADRLPGRRAGPFIRSL